MRKQKQFTEEQKQQLLSVLVGALQEYPTYICLLIVKTDKKNTIKKES